VRTLHLTGSPTSEFWCELSRLYAADCLRAVADPSRYDHHIAYVSPDGSWRFPADLEPATIAAARAMALPEALGHVRALAPEVMVPQLFCLAGMTSYRALFDVLGIPYLGNPPEVMALGADKARAKAVVAAAGVAVPPGEVCRRGDVPTIAPPAVVKPVDGDNSSGLGFVRNAADWDDALETAFAHSERVLVESYVELGREVRCGTLVRDGELLVLPLEEYAMDPQTKPVRGPEDKLGTVDGGLYLVAKDARSWIVDAGDPITGPVGEAAKRCHVALGCRHYGLFDFRVDPGGRPWFLEAGLYCSFAEASVISTMARALGISAAELFGIVVAQAVDPSVGRAVDQVVDQE
jgi:D-alanine-D-alanine ligase